MCEYCGITEKWEHMKQWVHLSDDEQGVVLEGCETGQWEKWEIENARFIYQNGSLAMIDTGGNA